MHEMWYKTIIISPQCALVLVLNYNTINKSRAKKLTYILLCNNRFIYILKLLKY